MHKNIYFLLFLSFIALKTQAQMQHDAIYMPKNTACVALMYSNNSWKNYWENTLKRDNANMGTHTTNTYMPMMALGIKDNLNVILSIPYIQTQTSAGNLKGQKGVQDLSIWTKYRLLNTKGLSLHTSVGLSIPTHKYVADFLPMSIGLGSKTATGRLIANYTHGSGLYVNTHASYIARGTLKIDKDAYQFNNKVINSNIVSVPDAIDAGARLGYWKNGIQAELFAERFACVSGDNIRRNDMPFPTNNMQATNIGFYAKYQPKNIGANFRINKTINGLNVGESIQYSVGVLFQFNNLLQKSK